MKDRDFDPQALDIALFCRSTGRLQAGWPVSGMARLADSLQGATDTLVQATAQGSLGPVKAGESEIWLHLQAQADVPLQCQRCLQPLIEPLAVDRRLRFVRTEAEAARLDEEIEDDVLVLQPRLNLHQLLEDELILALPLVPRHGVCPEPLPLAADPDEADELAPHPFAGLSTLRRSPPRGGTA